MPISKSERLDLITRTYNESRLRQSCICFLLTKKVKHTLALGDLKLLYDLAVEHGFDQYLYDNRKAKPTS